MTSQKRDAPALQRPVLSRPPPPLKVAIVCAPLFAFGPAVEIDFSYFYHFHLSVPLQFSLSVGITMI